MKVMHKEEYGSCNNLQLTKVQRRSCCGEHPGAVSCHGTCSTKSEARGMTTQVGSSTAGGEAWSSACCATATRPANTHNWWHPVKIEANFAVRQEFLEIGIDEFLQEVSENKWEETVKYGSSIRAWSWFELRFRQPNCGCVKWHHRRWNRPRKITFALGWNISLMPSVNSLISSSLHQRRWLI